MKPCFELKNVTIQYGSTPVVNNVSLQVAEGDFVGLAGPNGAGKSTLIKAILGLLPITQGEITLWGRPMRQFSEWSKIGYLPQKISTQNPLFPAAVEEVIALGLLANKSYPKYLSTDDQRKITEIMTELNIMELGGRLMTELSGGQQQRVVLARALVASPSLLFFDEPSTALDPESRESFFLTIKKLNEKRGVTIVLITHDTGYIGQYANKFMYLDQRLVYFGDFADFCHSKEMGQRFGEFDQHIICHQHH